MSKRKRTDDRVNNFRDTALPCGNPKRAQARDVLCMPSASALPVQGEDMETQGEKQLKVMAQKQLKTEVTMEEVLSQKRQFAEAGKYKPVTQEIRGVLRLPEYQNIAKGDQRTEILRQYGLNEDEVKLQLRQEGLNSGLEAPAKQKSTFGTNPDIQKEQLNAIETKMKEKDVLLSIPDSFRDQREVTRQELDIENSMFLGTEHDSHNLSHLLTKKKSGVEGDPSDPINHLPQIMANIEQQAREKILEKRRRRKRNRKKGHGAGSEDSHVEVDNGGGGGGSSDEHDEDSGVIGCLTLEEMEALKESQELSNYPAETLGTWVPVERKYTIRSRPGTSKAVCILKAEPTKCTSASDGENVAGSGSERDLDSTPQTSRNVLRGPIEFLPVEFIQENKLNLEEIKQLPKFANYEPGNPSNVLYVKNLSAHVSECDLVSLFSRFQDEGAGKEVVFKLMTGRMRGQAFVTFCDNDVASQALQLVNGFMLHGKPVILQYGKRKAS